MIYFDGAATTYPKPMCVKRAVMKAVEAGGNPGRSGHTMSMKMAEAVYSVREQAAEFFGAAPENVIFTSNCTHSLNLAVKGIAEPYLRSGSRIHVIISSIEHNSVLRPVHELTKRGLTYSIAEVHDNDEDTVREFEKLITKDTVAIISTIAGNVTGQLMPYEAIGKLCREKGICFIADGAQACGIIPVNMETNHINILCMPGHKGLYGITGTGLMITDGKYPLYHIMEGGTGSTSLEAEQTPFLPEALESGTLNTVGIFSVGAGLSFIKMVGMDVIHSHEDELCRHFIRRVKDMKDVTVYRHDNALYLPIVLFNVKGRTPEETAQLLSDKGFALRGGLHCSPLAHRHNGTLPDGAVRFAPSCFNSHEQVERLVKAVGTL